MRARCGALIVAYSAAAARADVDTETEPLPRQSYLRLEPSYNFSSDDGEVLTRVVFVYRGLFCPGCGPDSTASGLRIDVPVIDGGIGNIGLTEIAGLTANRNAFGLGAAVTLPTATAGEAGLQVGPAAFAQLMAIPHLELSVLVRELISVTGTLPTTTRIRPGAVLRMPDGVFVSSDGELAITGDTTTVPVNLRLGRSFGTHVVASIGPEIVAEGPRRGDVTARLQLNYVDF
jgi:hypothetical protein